MPVTWKLFDGTNYTAMTKNLVENVLAGAVLFQQTGGGGRYGDPHLRKAEKVAEKVKNGIISIQQARDSYGVVVDQETFAVDIEATQSKVK